MDFFPEITVTEAEAELMARGMLAVARADGKAHDRELAMVTSFYGEVVNGSPMQLASIEKEADVPPAVLAAGLTREPIGMLFIKTCILCAYADGTYHEKERAKVGQYAAALGIGDAALTELEQSVKEFLLGQLTGLQNRDAALEVAKELDLSGS
jgi:tellurite resistance protein